MHVAGDCESEVRGAEFVDHVPNVVFNGHHLLFDVADLRFLLDVLGSHLFDLLL
jgi:hypothetical protein